MTAHELSKERRKKHKTVPPAAGDHPNLVPIVSVVVSGTNRKSYLLKDGEILNQKPITLTNPDQTGISSLQGRSLFSHSGKK